MALDITSLATTAMTAVGSGGSAFLGAFFRFKARIATLETELSTLKARYETLSAGWRIEFTGLKQDFDDEFKHRTELERARGEGRDSRPDPLEALHEDLRQIRSDLNRLKEGRSHYVRNETFTSHVRAQEESWRTFERTLGNLEGALKGLK